MISMGFIKKIIKSQASKQIAKQSPKLIQAVADKIKSTPAKNLMKISSKVAGEVVKGSTSLTPYGKAKMVKNIIKLGSEARPHLKDALEDAKPHVNKKLDQSKAFLSSAKQSALRAADNTRPHVVSAVKKSKDGIIKGKDSLKSYVKELPSKDEIKEKYNIFKNRSSD